MKGEMTCPEPHTWRVTTVEFEPTQTDYRAEDDKHLQRHK
jgi:hypothetical protein